MKKCIVLSVLIAVAVPGLCWAQYIRMTGPGGSQSQLYRVESREGVTERWVNTRTGGMVTVERPVTGNVIVLTDRTSGERQVYKVGRSDEFGEQWIDTRTGSTVRLQTVTGEGPGTD